ncbi:MAG: cupin domain-containing protein [Oscillospiraceae bacterium]|nr:cupin domain-containing protein [Oscillospiraceae bacterium]
MELIKILTPDFLYPDERGLLVQLCGGGYEQVNAVFTKKGSIRGNFHYHKNTKEAYFVLSGKILLTAEKNGVTEKRVFETGEMFLIEEFVKHSLDFIEDTYLVVLYSKCVENADGTKDIHTC